MKADPRVDYELDAIIRAEIATAGGLRAAARNLGLTYGRVYKAAHRDGRKSPIADKAESHRSLTKDGVRQRDETAQLRAALKEAHREELDADKVREIHGLAAAHEYRPPGWLIEDRPGRSLTGVPVLFSSDWHLQEVVRKAEVGGVNEFDAEIAAQRVRNMVERTIDLCVHHMTNPSYPGIVYALGGDIITGNIHEELARTNDRTVMEGVLAAFDQNVWVIEQLAARFGRVFVPGVPGNHGRSTLKPVMKGRVQTSYEWMLYCMLERHFKPYPEVRFYVPLTGDAHFNLYGHRFMLTHGDVLGVKGGDGIIGALGPITRGRIKTAASEAQVGREFDTLMIGHYHTYMALPASGLIVNGALKGYDEYARLGLRARFQRAIQALFFVHPKHGITYNIPVFVDDVPAKAARASWASWEQSA